METKTGQVKAVSGGTSGQHGGSSQSVQSVKRRARTVKATKSRVKSTKPAKSAKPAKSSRRVAKPAKSATHEKYARGTRSYTMSHIRGKDTSIEVLVRRYLFSRGLRFRKNDKRYPGHPDVVLPKWHAMVFVNGCFWHMHEGCSKFKMPKSNVEFWTAKLIRNRDRDIRQHAELEAAGWKVITVWECELAKPKREARLERLYRQITEDCTDETSPAHSESV